MKNEKTKIVVRKIGIRVRGKRNPIYIYIDINIEMFMFVTDQTKFFGK